MNLILSLRESICNTEHQTSEHVLQRCPTYDSIRKQIWSQPKTTEEKLWGKRDDLLLTVEFVEAANDLNSRSIKKLNAEEVPFKLNF